MANKKSNQLILLFLFISFLAAAQTAKPPATPVKQSKFYVKAYGGYGLLTPGSFQLTNVTVINAQTTFEVVSPGLGAGFHFGGGVGIILSDFLNLGIDGDYLSNKDLNGSSKGTAATGDFKVYSTKITSSILSIVPNITFKAISTETYYIYTRIGILIAVSTKSAKSIIDSNYQQSLNPIPYYSTHTTTEYSYGVGAGVQVAVGIQFGITENLRGFGELVGYYLPISPNSSTDVSTTYTYGSPNTLPASTSPHTPPDASTNYISSGTIPPNSNFPKTTYNVNYIGINIGVAYKF
jgi:opacity protein-like surface antigen